MTEGITALVAAVVLLYMGFWMHSKPMPTVGALFSRSSCVPPSPRVRCGPWRWYHSWQCIARFRDGAVLSSPVAASCPSVCPHTWGPAGRCRNARRARVAAFTRQYPSPSRDFFRCYLGSDGAASGDLCRQGDCGTPGTGLLASRTSTFPWYPRSRGLPRPSRPAATGSSDSDHCRRLYLHLLQRQET